MSIGVDYDPGNACECHGCDEHHPIVGSIISSLGTSLICENCLQKALKMIRAIKSLAKEIGIELDDVEPVK